ncbi:hypothetical protein [Gemella morbillorum]|uniref:LptM family lipoprotein n=1 Tax=Gemella morbillorum TaxID=29391 RepID=UPI0028D2390A|nr:hypothetical protein [Gemella morbillorum]
MKKIITLIMSILIISVLAGCGITGKGSKSWIEKQVSDIEKVYPTENPEDLFEKFPNGFRIEQARISQKNGKNHIIKLEMDGNPKTKSIQGSVREIYREYDPFKETIEKESKVEYIKDKGLVLEKSELTTELLPKNYFLFQKLKLNKDILKKLEVKDKSYSFETDSYNIKYVFTNKEIDNYLKLNKQKVILDIIGQYSEKNKLYFHTVVIEENTQKIDFSEKIVEERGDK